MLGKASEVSKIKNALRFLGTGTSTGLPVLGCACEVCHSGDSRDKRLRSSVLLNLDGYRLLVDTSPDIRTQLLRIGETQIDAIFITHAHKDYLSGLDDLRAIHFFQKKTIPLYTSKETVKAIQRDFYYAFDPSLYSSLFGIQIHVIDPSTPFLIHGHLVTPVALKHAAMEVLGLRIGTLTYITDTNAIAEQELSKIRGSQTLVIGALGREPHHSHFCLNEALELSQRLSIPQTYITHIGHQMGFHEAVCRTLPKGVALAYDDLSVLFEA